MKQKASQFGWTGTFIAAEDSEQVPPNGNRCLGHLADQTTCVSDLGVGVEGRENLVVHDVHGGDRGLVGVEPAPGIAGVAIDGGLEIDLAHALDMADEKGVASARGTVR